MKVAVLLAVEKFGDARIGPAPYAGADAVAFAAALEQHGFAAADRVVLVNEQATKTSVESRVKRALRGLREEDDLLVFYAGRGFTIDGANFITCYDTDPDDLPDTSIPLHWLFKQLQGAACRQTACFFDARAGEMPANHGSRAADADWSDAELRQFFESREHCVCFSARRTKESSHASDALKHGIWTFHVIEALNGRAPAAAINGAQLTSTSLQSYLEQEVPRTLARTLAGKKGQTPWMVAGRGGEVLLADLNDVPARRQETAAPGALQLTNIALQGQRTTDVRRLTRFSRAHKPPERVNSATEAFIGRIASDEIAAEIHSIFARLKAAFQFKRADMHIANQGDGNATIITPYFNYSFTVRLDRKDASQVVFRRTVDAIKEPDRIVSEQFAEVFAGAFNTVELTAPEAIDLPALVDRIEALDDERIQIDYDPDVTCCCLRVGSVPAEITVTARTLSIGYSAPQSPQRLLQSFSLLQRLLAEEHDVFAIFGNK